MKEKLIMDSKAFKNIVLLFNFAELGRILSIACTVESDRNISHTLEGEFHTDDSLREFIGCTKTAYSTLMKKLVEHDIVQYLPVKELETGKTYKLIMFNPTLARKTNVLRESCVNRFSDLTVAK